MKSYSISKKALNCFETLGDSIGQSFALRDIGRAFTILSKKDSAIMCYEKRLLLEVDLVSFRYIKN